MPKTKRIKTNYPGVFYVMGRSMLRPGKSERIYYIRYRKNGREIEEKAGRQFQDDMNASKAAKIRVECINGKRLSRKELQKEVIAKKKQKQAGKVVPESLAMKTETISTTIEKSSPLIRQEIYEEIFKNSNDAIVLIDSTGTVLELNEAQEYFFGWSREESIGRSIFEIGVIPAELERITHDGIRLSIVGKVPRFLHEFELNRKDGTRVFVEISTQVLKKSGSPTCLINIIRDITERKRMEHALQDSEEMARALLNATTDAVMLVDREGSIRDLNKAFAHQFRLPRKELLGKKLWALIPTELNEIKKTTDQVFRTGKSVRIDKEYRGMATDNIIYPVRDIEKNVSYVAIFSRDISKLKKAEKDLVKHKNHLEELVKQRTANLEQANIALKVLLKRREEDKTELEEKVMFNIKELVLPYLEEWKDADLNRSHKTLADIVYYNLNEIVAPFAKTLASQYYNFSRTEIRIASLIKQGKTTKEIARQLKTSARTIDTHRYSIRKKLGISLKKINLSTYLQSIK